ncbi:MAG: M15 family metallopeptidase [Pyrinomonadaceae bacterium]
MPFGQFSLSRIQTLQPAVQPIALSLLERCESAGVPCEVVQGTRTFSEQQAVYDQGRTTPGAVVTKARPGDSFHQYGLAFDVAPVAYKNLPDWNPSGPAWLVIGQIGEGLGLHWGGRWSTPDAPHFELHAAPLSELKAYWEKFKTVMPITIEPTIGAFGIIMLIAAVYFMWLRPLMARRGYV